MDEQGCSRLLADANGRILDRLAGLEKVITPQLAQQALSIAHFVIRALRLEAATSVQIDVDRLSFKGCFQILKTRLSECHGNSDWSLDAWYEAVIWELSCKRQPIRRNRINPRVTKRKMSRWGKCRPSHRGRKRLKKPFENTVIMVH